MKIIFINNFPFPNGQAATNRIISLGNGLSKEQLKVKYIITRPTEKKNNIINPNRYGSYKGIEYLYSSNSTTWSNFVLIKIIQALYGYVNMFRIIRKEIKSNKNIIFLNGIQNIFLAYFSYIIIKKIYRRKYFYIIDELPSELRIHSLWKKYFMFYFNIEEKFIYRLFDGIIVMTYNLREYVIGRKVKENLIKVIPMTVEMDRFQNIEIISQKKNYLLYIGNLDPDKDNVKLILEAFKEITNKYEDLYLYFIGKPSDQHINYYNSLIAYANKLGLKKKVIFLGNIKRDYIPEYIMKSTICLLIRVINLRVRYGFPTKLGEYLASGRPVLLNSFGEENRYLEDGKSAFIVNDNSLESLINKINFILSNPKKADDVGLFGREICKQVFNSDVQAKNLKTFIMDISQI